MKLGDLVMVKYFPPLPAAGLTKMIGVYIRGREISNPLTTSIAATNVPNPSIFKIHTVLCDGRFIETLGTDEVTLIQSIDNAL